MKQNQRLSCAAIVFAGWACAHAPTQPVTELAGSKPADTRIVVTGSHIPQRVDPQAEFPATVSAVRIIGRRDLDRTGRADPAVALRAIEPSAR